MKPLVLNIYPLDPSFPRGYVLPRDTRVTFAAANRAAKEKHLTAAECAAEYFKARDQCLIEIRPGAFEFDESMAETLHRFATLPHASERNYQ